MKQINLPREEMFQLIGLCPKEDFIPALEDRLIACKGCKFSAKCELGQKNLSLSNRLEKSKFNQINQIKRRSAHV